MVLKVSQYVKFLIKFNQKFVDNLKIQKSNSTPGLYPLLADLLKTNLGNKFIGSQILVNRSKPG